METTQRVLLARSWLRFATLSAGLLLTLAPRFSPLLDAQATAGDRSHYWRKKRKRKNSSRFFSRRARVSQTRHVLPRSRQPTLILKP